MVTAVFDAVGRFCRGMPSDDDITLVVIKFAQKLSQKCI
jgi:serine phosphatase RsbU (regulator of sigma subunit)